MEVIWSLVAQLHRPIHELQPLDEGVVDEQESEDSYQLLHRGSLENWG